MGGKQNMPSKSFMWIVLDRRRRRIARRNALTMERLAVDAEKWSGGVLPLQSTWLASAVASPLQ
jgi:hypothetical protein